MLCTKRVLDIIGFATEIHTMIDLKEDQLDTIILRKARETLNDY